MWGLSSFPRVISVYSPWPQTLNLICWVQTLSTGCHSSVSVFSLPKWWCAINLSLFLMVPHSAFKSCLCCRVYTQFISSQHCRICQSAHPVLWVSEGAFSSPHQDRHYPPEHPHGVFGTLENKHTHTHTTLNKVRGLACPLKGNWKWMQKSHDAPG